MAGRQEWVAGRQAHCCRCCCGTRALNATLLRGEVATHACWHLTRPPPGSAPQGLTGDRAGSRAALEALEQLFSAGGGRGERRTTIVLVDELDLLVNKAQVGGQLPSLTACSCAARPR